MERALDLIKEMEGFRSDPYLCPAGIPTIGYGTTVYSSGHKVTLQDPPISELLAIKELRKFVGKIADDIEYWENKNNIELRQGEFEALLSFIYNVGWATFKKSTLCKKILAGDMAGAAEEFPRWVYAGKKKLPGLVRRREKERALFLSGMSFE